MHKSSPPTPQSAPQQNMLEKALSPALENYLAIIFRLEYATGACRASDIAEAAGVARPSVTSALRMLSRLGYVTYSPYKLINLTEQGVVAGQKLAHRKLVLHDFFANVLQLPADLSEATACGLEHLMSDAALLRLRQFVLYMHHHEDQWKTWRKDYESLAATLPSRHEAHNAQGTSPSDTTPPMTRLRAPKQHV